MAVAAVSRARLAMVFASCCGPRPYCGGPKPHLHWIAQSLRYPLDGSKPPRRTYFPPIWRPSSRAAPLLSSTCCRGVRRSFCVERHPRNKFDLDTQVAVTWKEGARGGSGGESRGGTQGGIPGGVRGGVLGGVQGAVGIREQRLKRNVSLMSMTSYFTSLYNSHSMRTNLNSATVLGGLPSSQVMVELRQRRGPCLGFKA